MLLLCPCVCFFCFVFLHLRNLPLFCRIFQRGSFVSSNERYFVEPVDEQKTNASTNFRKFHIVFRRPTERKDDLSNGSTCGVKGKLPFQNIIQSSCVHTRLQKPTPKAVRYVCIYREIFRNPTSLSSQRQFFCYQKNHSDIAAVRYSGNMHQIKWAWPQQKKIPQVP